MKRIKLEIELVFYSQNDDIYWDDVEEGLPLDLKQVLENNFDDCRTNAGNNNGAMLREVIVNNA